jgi:KDO2-lipid IV(A) lauroyltransferase
MAGLYIARRFPVTTLYRPPRVRELDAFIRAARERTGATLVPTDAGGVRALYRALAQGEVVAVLPDQDPGRGGGVFAPFFGQPAWTMALLSRLATRSGAPVFFGFARRLPRGDGYRLEFLPALAATTSVELTESAAAVNAAVEVCVRRVPAQYQWSYKRFKTRPPGEPRWY